MEINKLVILDKNDFNKEQKQELKKLAFETIIYDDLPKDEKEAIKRIGDADAVIVCWYSINKNILDACPNIKYLGIVATGVEWCDVNYALKKRIFITNIPAYSTNAVSNFVFSQLKGFLLNNKTLGVIGLGNIGKRVAKIGKSKSLNVICWDRTFKDDYNIINLEEIFKKADIISFHLKLVQDTEKFIKNSYLDLLKKDSILINTVSSKLFEDINYLAKIVNSKNITLILDFDEDKNLSELAKTNKNIIYTPPYCLEI